ncbi:magnesium transporter MgtE N-terminal domain-containing protein [Janibacter cremeus]|uniref:Flagellar motility protein MotE (MotC chaperone)/sporulation protein YlmC with PRC-barrel domain n=1 Tax=Janibacter cremeus TaxID=1285192 RepID=A0A852VS29_9MICO|nr:flagellar motility protein MotE (MotC chaperone)/sporulation protein YlmC with PRC-barrel domain [Janibacter cremeus]
MSAPSRFFVARLASLNVFDPLGDQVGRVRDVVVTFAPSRRPRAIGLVVEVPGRRRVFVPMTRVISVEGGQVITTGLVNMRRFEQRATETLVLAELLERPVTVRTDDGEVEATVEDVGIEQSANRTWTVTKVFVRGGRKTRRGLLVRRRGETFTVPIEDVTGLSASVSAAEHSAVKLLESIADLKVADVAEVISDLAPQRREAVVAALSNDRLADILQELGGDDQAEILSILTQTRAADVLEAMDPDDAADLLSQLPADRAETLLQLMKPDDAEPLRRLLSYDENTAGGLMTTEPVVLAPEDTVAEALAIVRREEVTVALAATVYVCRPPLETPTGKYLGMIHIQRLLREPPHESIGRYIDKAIDPLRPEAPLGLITRTLATYNLVSAPVVDESEHLLGAVTVDDVLDHILPEDWREERHEVTDG